MCFSFSPCSAATLARGGIMLFGKPLLLRKSNERPSRLTHGLGLMMGKNTAPAAASTSAFKPQRALFITCAISNYSFRLPNKLLKTTNDE
jgi:hypothetical protein